MNTEGTAVATTPTSYRDTIHEPSSAFIGGIALSPFKSFGNDGDVQPSAKPAESISIVTAATEMMVF